MRRYRVDSIGIVAVVGNGIKGAFQQFSIVLLSRAQAKQFVFTQRILIIRLNVLYITFLRQTTQEQGWKEFWRIVLN